MSKEILVKGGDVSVRLKRCGLKGVSLFSPFHICNLED
jgi:hypothetical protein